MAREVNWDDGGEATKGGGERIGRYKAEQGRRDMIRVLSTCYAFRMHWIPERSFYTNCGLDDDGGGTCLICQRKDESGAQAYPPAEKFGALIMLIAQKSGRSDWKAIQEVQYWGFGRDKFKSLYELGEDYGDIRKIDLIVSCTDSQMQRLNFAPTGKDSQLDVARLKDQIENAKKWLKLSISPASIKQQKRALGMDEDADVDTGVVAALSVPEDEDSAEAEVGPVEAIQDEVENLLDEIGDI